MTPLPISFSFSLSVPLLVSLLFPAALAYWCMWPLVKSWWRPYSYTDFVPQPFFYTGKAVAKRNRSKTERLLMSEHLALSQKRLVLRSILLNTIEYYAHDDDEAYAFSLNEIAFPCKTTVTQEKKVSWFFVAIAAITSVMDVVMMVVRIVMVIGIGITLFKLFQGGKSLVAPLFGAGVLLYILFYRQKPIALARQQLNDLTAQVKSFSVSYASHIDSDLANLIIEFEAKSEAIAPSASLEQANQKRAQAFIMLTKALEDELYEKSELDARAAAERDFSD